jgi:hypothetical protein
MKLLANEPPFPPPLLGPLLLGFRHALLLSWKVVAPPQSRQALTYVGVIWFVFHVLQLLLVRFTQQYLCCIEQIYCTVEPMQQTIFKISPPCFQSWS